MKKISIVVPCFNEEENVVPMANAIREIFKNNLSTNTRLFLLTMIQKTEQEN